MITAARIFSNTLMSSHYCRRKIIKVYDKENKIGHVWVPSGGEYSDPDPAKLLNACLSLNMNFPLKSVGVLLSPTRVGGHVGRMEDGNSLNICPSNELRLVTTLRRTEHFLHKGRLRKPYCKVPGHTRKYGSAANRAQLFSFWYCCHKYVSLFL